MDFGSQETRVPFQKHTLSEPLVSTTEFGNSFGPGAVEDLAGERVDTFIAVVLIP
jgi:hypothetical protein